MNLVVRGCGTLPGSVELNGLIGQTDIDTGHAEGMRAKVRRQEKSGVSQICSPARTGRFGNTVSIIAFQSQAVMAPSLLHEPSVR